MSAPDALADGRNKVRADLKRAMKLVQANKMDVNDFPLFAVLSDAHGELGAAGIVIADLLAAARQSRTAPNADLKRAAVEILRQWDTDYRHSPFASESELETLANRLLAMGTAPEHDPLAILLDKFAPEKWRCMKCGCLWRLNQPLDKQRSWSLWNATQKSCVICDNSPEFMQVIVPAANVGDEMLELLRAVERTALASAVPVEQRIPREPTKAMIEAGRRGASDENDVWNASDLWRAMYDAASLQDTQE